MDFCVQPPVKMSIGAEKLLINPSQMSVPLSPKPAAISGTMALKRTPMHRLSLPASGVLYHGLIRVVPDIHPSLDLLRFFLRSVFHFTPGSVDPLSFSVATAHRRRPARTELLLPSLLARGLIVRLLMNHFPFMLFVELTVN